MNNDFYEVLRIQTGLNAIFKISIHPNMGSMPNLHKSKMAAYTSVKFACILLKIHLVTDYV